METTLKKVCPHVPLQRQPKARAVEREYPHFVDVVVPPGGLGTKLDAMYEFHARRGIRARRGHGRHDADGSVVRWCFADLAIAAAFAKEFEAFKG